MTAIVPVLEGVYEDADSWPVLIAHALECQVKFPQWCEACEKSKCWQGDESSGHVDYAMVEWMRKRKAT